ncbi:DNA polymerase delta catalytic subunit [Acorus calamus]|uniref:DNA polymerase n=1 Tax=Acorus calamus TaxID=4465 RepID=A0AAV9CUT0_ACOCL|nr:DNA polymerase delta catalytic subunit [Acorus calamus]
MESTGPPLLHAALRLMPDSINSNQPGTDAYRSFCARCKVGKNSESCQCTSEFAGAVTCSNDLSFIDSSKINLDKTVEGLYQGQTLALTSLTDFTDKCTGSHQANNITNNSQAEEGLPVQFDNHREGNLRFRLNYLQTKDHSSGEHDLHVDKGRSCIEHIEMTFNRKAPTRDQIKSSCESSVMATVHNRDSAGSLSNPSEALVCNNSVFDSGGQHIDDLHPFFVNKFKKEERVDAYQTKETHFTPRKIVQGVPTHFQNDGSLLYLLTPALAPPSLECVNQWLRNSEQNSLGLNKGISSDCFHEEQGKSSMKADLCLKTNNDCLHDVHKVQQIQEQIASFEAETNLKYTDHVMGKSQTGDIQMKVKKCTENLQEVSQISGPDEKSKLTPLSQIGFCDPASVGAGQQLTMVSIEVQTESRGDFRPDPQFDAVNIIALVVQGDNDDTFEVYVLLRAKDGELSGRNIDGVSNCKFVNFLEERQLLHHFVNIICSCDPDILMGWEIQGGSLGFLAERAAHLGIGLLKNISRATVIESKPSVKNSASPEERADDMLSEVLEVDPVALKDTVIEDEWGRTHASGIHVSGRIVLNIWRLMRAELKLNMYTLEAVTEAVLRLKVPSIPIKILNQWFSTGPERARFRSIDYIIKRAKLNLQIMNQLDMINRTSELARIFGIDFFSVLSRGSQYRVESMLLRLAHTQNYLCISPGSHQVSSQPAMECLPLVMEPESGFYTDPVIVLDFQSLYPSMIIGYNLCFSTCLGKVLPSKENVLGVSSYSAEPQLLRDLFQQILLTPNGVMYVPSKVRKGVLPRLLEEILSTRIMVKQAMKKLMPSEQVLHRVFNARQLALKLIANVTYGYTAAGFSGRMPCAELADSIVQCGRRTLEKAILFVNTHETWRARVIYGDTDSMFVLLKGRSMEEAFRIGHEIASSVTAMNPSPVTLKMEKVYQPCVLLTKKRYVGYSYESPDQGKPVFDAKGIETVRRDTCPAVAKALEHSLRILFEEQDILKVKLYLERQWTRILSGKISIQDFVFAKEVRLGTYSVRSSSLPPAAIVATKAMRADPRAEPLHGERVPYVVIHGEPGARLIDMVLNPLDFLQMNSPYRLNDLYYINKQIIPALQRVFGLVGADLNQWFLDMPRPIRSTLAKRHYNQSSRGSVKSRIDNYYLSKHCALCGKLVQASSYLCKECSIKEPIVAIALIGRTSKLERDIHHLSAICRHCGGGDWITENGVKCTSLSCSVFYERRKVQKELQALSTVATDKRFYPTCMAEWF